MHNMADFLESKYNIELQTVELVWKYPSNWFLENKNEYKDNIQYLKENDIIDKVRLIALIFKRVKRANPCFNFSTTETGSYEIFFRQNRYLKPPLFSKKLRVKI